MSNSNCRLDKCFLKQVQVDKEHPFYPNKIGVFLGMAKWPNENTAVLADEEDKQPFLVAIDYVNEIIEIDAVDIASNNL